MKTKSLIFILIVIQSICGIEKTKAQCGDFTLYPTASYFDYGAGTGRAVVSMEFVTKVEKKTLGFWSVECGYVYADKQMVFKLYMSSGTTLNSNSVLLSVTSTYKNPTHIYTADILNKRYFYSQDWNDVSLNYTLPQNMSVCTFNNQYKYLIIKTIYSGDTTKKCESYIAIPGIPAPSFTTSAFRYCSSTSTSAQVCVNSLAGASSYNWTYPSGWTGPATTTTPCTTVNFNNQIKSGDVCCQAIFSCGSSSPVGCKKLYYESPPTDAGIYWPPPTVTSTPTPAKKSVTLNMGSYYFSIYHYQIGSDGHYHGYLLASNESDEFPSGRTVSVIMLNNDILNVGAYRKNSCGRTEGIGRGYKMVNGQLQPYELVRENVSVDENQEINFSVYPNPANDLITISKNNSSEFCNLFLYNALGKKVKELIGSVDDMAQMNVSDLENGIYFLQMENENGIIRKEKIVIAH